MPEITDIKKQKRSDTRYSVYLDGEYSFALTDLELSTSGLRIGQELADEEVEKYQQQAGEAKTYAMGLRFLSYRPRSVYEMRSHLRRKGAETGDVDAAVARMLGAGLLDDREFVDSWIRDRQALRPRSRRMLEQELMAKGVDREDIRAALSAVDGDSELDALAMLMERKRRLPQYAQPEKLLGYFARQGYTYDQLKKALERLEDKDSS
jgi:regulatory protein